LRSIIKTSDFFSSGTSNLSFLRSSGAPDKIQELASLRCKLKGFFPAPSPTRQSAGGNPRQFQGGKAVNHTPK